MEATPEISQAPAMDAMADPRLKRLREVTGRIIGSVFYGTLLRTLRTSELKGDYGHGGYGETVFQGQLDQILSERAGAARHNSLSAALVVRLAEQQLRIDQMKQSREQVK